MSGPYRIGDKNVEHYEIELMPTALALHMACKGSSDQDPDAMAEAAMKLHVRLANWTPPRRFGPNENPPHCFDTSVECLCRAALWEYEEFQKYMERK